MEITIQARYIDKSDGNKILCFKHAVQAVMVKQSDIEVDLNDHGDYGNKFCAVCNPSLEQYNQFHNYEDDYDTGVDLSKLGDETSVCVVESKNSVSEMKDGYEIKSKKKFWRG